ncbi:hypothetical protein SIN8267_03113 [Sinobacterium norvegicum]|uniref:SRPBCC domain-containing protein n=1 Tax=Sinobacterium norvegicum TaxID=1641715 RepID=A0ABM9AIE7_9GAMM|nr:SRPBCC domain-containing protein [Sinobacterium norvegicum]CAH0992974.1 hypothetical protein SIN8267_03113 [Sinobacterium norvegicum]
MITENAVISDTVTINAPVELVWQILVDFEQYHRWNKFCPQIINHRLAIGEAVDMQVELGNGLQQQVEYIEEITPNTSISWGVSQPDKETLYASRSQRLTALDNNRCEYVSVDAFSGKLTALVIEHSGAAVERGFNLCAYGLKEYAEAQFQQQA